MAAPNPPFDAAASSGSAAPVGKAAVAAPDPLVALHGRRVVLGVTGGIAAYKAVDVCRRLVDARAHVLPVLPHHAPRFLGALAVSAPAAQPARPPLLQGPRPDPPPPPRRRAEPERIAAAAADVLAESGDLAGLRVLVTAGGTREPIDPVRFVGNRSSGKMGYAVAERAARRGAAVTLVTTIGRPTDASGIAVERVDTADDMARAVLSRFADSDVVVMAAAVADFRPKAVADEKLKKRDGLPEVVLEPTPDVLAELGERKQPGQLLVGFAAETEHVEEHAAEKLTGKRVDMMVANDVSAADSGFEVDTNRAILLYSSGSQEKTPLLDKHELADLLLDRVAAVLAGDPTGAKRAR